MDRLCLQLFVAQNCLTVRVPIGTTISAEVIFAMCNFWTLLSMLRIARKFGHDSELSIFLSIRGTQTKMLIFGSRRGPLRSGEALEVSAVRWLEWTQSHLLLETRGRRLNIFCCRKLGVPQYLQRPLCFCSRLLTLPHSKAVIASPYSAIDDRKLFPDDHANVVPCLTIDDPCNPVFQHYCVSATQ